MFFLVDNTYRGCVHVMVTCVVKLPFNAPRQTANVSKLAYQLATVIL